MGRPIVRYSTITEFPSANEKFMEVEVRHEKEIGKHDTCTLLSI